MAYLLGKAKQAFRIEGSNYVKDVMVGSVQRNCSVNAPMQRGLILYLTAEPGQSSKPRKKQPEHLNLAQGGIIYMKLSVTSVVDDQKHESLLNLKPLTGGWERFYWETIMGRSTAIDAL